MQLKSFLMQHEGHEALPSWYHISAHEPAHESFRMTCNPQYLLPDCTMLTWFYLTFGWQNITCVGSVWKNDIKHKNTFVCLQINSIYKLSGRIIFLQIIFMDKRHNTIWIDSRIEETWWRRLPHYWPNVRGFHRSTVVFPHKRPEKTTPQFGVFLTWAWTGCWTNNQIAVGLRCHDAHVIMKAKFDRSICFQTPEKSHHSCGTEETRRGITVKPVYNDHLMGYFSAFWSKSRWPRAT